jgi:hypothetical protein
VKEIKSTMNEFYQHMANVIAEKKRIILAIPNNKKEPGFFYTIGNQEKGSPELLVIGNFDPDAITILLNELSEKLLEQGKPFNNGELINLGGEQSVAVWSATDHVHTEYTIQAGQFYGNEDYEVQQVVIPDNNGRWPEDPLCHKSWRVPVHKKLQLNS